MFQRYGVDMILNLLLSMIFLGGEPPVATVEVPQRAFPLHSHNDYWRKRPLLDALAAGCLSLEADVVAVDGRLAVAHERSTIRNGRDLEPMYLAPLAKIVRDRGRIYPDDPRPLILMVDVKGSWSDAEPMLRALTGTYADILHPPAGTYAGDGGVVLATSGAGAGRGRLAAGLSAIDGRPDDLGREIDSAAMPMVSLSFRSRWGWKGADAFTPEELADLKKLTAQARAEGRLLRFWSAPDFPSGWDFLMDSGVGLISTDRPAAAAKHLRERAAAKKAG